VQVYSRTSDEFLCDIRQSPRHRSQ